MKVAVSGDIKQAVYAPLVVDFTVQVSSKVAHVATTQVHHVHTPTLLRFGASPIPPVQETNTGEDAALPLQGGPMRFQQGPMFQTSWKLEHVSRRVSLPLPVIRGTASAAPST